MATKPPIPNPNNIPGLESADVIGKCTACSQPLKVSEWGGIFTPGNWGGSKEEPENDLTGEEWDLCDVCTASVLTYLQSLPRK